MRQMAKYVAVSMTLTMLACSPQQSQKARVTTPAEASAIVALLMPNWPRQHFCVNSTFRPPLEDQVEAAEWEKARQQKIGVWGRAGRWLGSFLKPQREAMFRNWSLPGSNEMGESVFLRREDSEKLNGLLTRGADADLNQTQAEMSLPSSVTACTEKQLQNDNEDAEFLGRISVSQPVIVDQIAFVEIGTICGGLCGSGRLIALIKRSGKWTALAESQTWIS